MKAGDVVKCKADIWFNAYGDESRAVTKDDPPALVIATKRVGGAVFLRLDSVNEDTWFWEDGFVPARLN